ncbi:MAG TPA: radical SAM protein [Syntrophomonadaceae bacterium]|nr:radical SAM protein [Syntrophomonadaceae bacterium]
MELRFKDFLKQIKATTRAAGQPYWAGFELTPRCNFKCKMCYVCKPPNDKEVQSRELTAQQWIQLAKKLREAGVLIITLTGGEVFIRPDFQEIYEEIAKMGFLIKIYTNGAMMTPQIIEWLSKIPPFKVCVTVYGESRDTYQEVTGHADGYDRTIRAIDGLMAAGIVTHIRTTVIRDNVNKLKLLRKVFLDRKSRFAIIDYVTPRREGANTDPEGCRLSAEEVIGLEVNIRNLERQERINSGETPILFDGDDDIEKENSSKGNSILDPTDAFRCGAGKNNLWITWDGRLTPCSLMDQPYTTILDKEFSEAWQELKDKCRSIPPCHECSNCAYRATCYSCPARLFLETGFYDRPAPYLCETARLRSEYLHSLNLGESK